MPCSGHWKLPADPCHAAKACQWHRALRDLSWVGVEIWYITAPHCARSSSGAVARPLKDFGGLHAGENGQAIAASTLFDETGAGAAAGVVGDRRAGPGTAGRAGKRDASCRA